MEIVCDFVGVNSYAISLDVVEISYNSSSGAWFAKLTCFLIKGVSIEQKAGFCLQYSPRTLTEIHGAQAKIRLQQE